MAIVALQYIYDGGWRAEEGDTTGMGNWCNGNALDFNTFECALLNELRD
jgi:hypothetical protein